ncbi:tyrosine-type recombinase/integrase [Pseudahrensia aquimaris]|uniref:Tyrosine-type recombinase/integrase n=1 Tax=Pseudahrensia aquimaris TaxID=744461 RepID=A0ABW3FAP2_9HYPH
MPLTDVQIRNAKPAPKPFKMFDGNGLFLHVQSSGSKLWRMKYRHAGKKKLLSFGRHPIVSLRDARAKRDEALALIFDGHDPSQIKQDNQRQRELEAASSFSVICDEYLDKLHKEGKSQATLTKINWLMDMAKAAFGNRPITEITARDILVPLKKIEAEGKHETATRLRSTIGRVFRYAVATARAETDPTFALQGALISPKVKNHAAIVSEGELGQLLRDIDAFNGYRVTVLGLKLLALLYPRPGELRNARWNEFDFEKRIWSIPAERTKMRKPHQVPLPAQAIELLKELKQFSPHNDLVMPSISNSQKPISDNTMNQALRRMGYTSEQMTAHGFRATFATLANESGLWNPDAIERALAHVDSNSVRRVYSRGAYWEERVKMADWWGDKLCQLIK